MQTPLKKAFKVGAIFFIILAVVLCTLPINLFDGIIVLERVQGIKVNVPTRLSLCYFLGIGIEDGDLNGINTFYLVPKGIATAVILLLGFPTLLGYRTYLKETSPKKDNVK